MHHHQPRALHLPGPLQERQLRLLLRAVQFPLRPRLPHRRLPAPVAQLLVRQGRLQLPGLVFEGRDLWELHQGRDGALALSFF